MELKQQLDQEEKEVDEGYATRVGEKLIAALFPYLLMSPEEWVAREGLSWFERFELGLCRYRDTELEAWLHRVQALLSSKEQIEELQKTLLSPEEIQQAKHKAEEDFQRLRSLGVGEPT